MDMQQEITVPLGEYHRLCADSDKLAALEAAGVNNWQGYEHAMAILEEMEEGNPS